MTDPRILDIARQIGAIRRDVAEDGDLVRVQMDRRYPSPTADVWDALTDPDRISRWMLPISGDFRVGGNFQLEGNAGGEILHCERPSLLRVTFGDPSSLVEVRLVADGSDTVLTLEHTVPKAMAGGVAGALYVGPGWDGALLGSGSLPGRPGGRGSGGRRQLAGGAGVLRRVGLGLGGRPRGERRGRRDDRGGPAGRDGPVRAGPGGVAPASVLR